MKFILFVVIALVVLFFLVKFLLPAMRNR